jgi:uncharacterized membrane protein
METLKEIFKVFASVVCGALLMFVIQPAIFQPPLSLVRLQFVQPTEWLKSSYTPAAIIVFFVCVIATIIWYCVTLRLDSKARQHEDIVKMTWWWCLLLSVITAIVIAVSYFYGKDSLEARIPLTICFALDTALIFWVGTAISSPGKYKKVVPFPNFLR